MKIIKLNESHILAVRPLFENTKYMGAFLKTTYFIPNHVNPVDHYHTSFYTTYLSDLKNYHAYGAMNDEGNIVAVLSFYESIDDASWYWNHIRTVGNNADAIKLILDRVIEHNEDNGRFKFYSLFPKNYISTYRRLAFSKYNSERYDYFDEFSVDEKHQCTFTLPWQILYTRTLVPVDTVVRCTFLKQKYRTSLYNAGSL